MKTARRPAKNLKMQTRLRVGVPRKRIWAAAALSPGCVFTKITKALSTSCLKSLLQPPKLSMPSDKPVPLSCLIRWLQSRDEGTSVVFAPGVDVSLLSSLCANMWHFPLSAGSCGHISNECFTGPSGLGVLAGLNASGLCGCPHPSTNAAALGRVMPREAEDKSGWSGMAIKCNRVSVGAVALRR